MLLGASKRIAEFASKHKLPAVYPDREFVDAGGLMAYGPDLGANFRRAGGYIVVNLRWLARDILDAAEGRGTIKVRVRRLGAAAS